MLRWMGHLTGMGGMRTSEIQNFSRKNWTKIALVRKLRGWDNIKPSLKEAGCILLYCYLLRACVSYRWVLDWMIGFIDALSIPLGTTGNYNAIVIPTLYRSLLHKLVSSLFYTLHSSFPVNGFVTVSL
jgi:hypothetical protein